MIGAAQLYLVAKNLNVCSLSGTSYTDDNTTRGIPNYFNALYFASIYWNFGITERSFQFNSTT